jgi:hypothetical protein
VTTFGQLNILAGWIFISVGITTGSILGMWSFGGPFPTPNGHHEYADLPRRLNRLAHIACFMLPIINILYGQYLDQTMLPDTLKQVGSYGMIICMIGVPLLLFLASFKPIFKYFEVIPVTCGTVALYLMSYAHFQVLMNR